MSEMTQYISWDHSKTFTTRHAPGTKEYNDLLRQYGYEVPVHWIAEAMSATPPQDARQREGDEC